MLHWYIVLLYLPSTIHAIGHPRYECGEHGRFEYCIDGVPGCIVGCHCHPGYYFDTESKICEANSKLVQEYRRMFLAEPTRVEIPMTPSDFMGETVPTPTTTNPLDNQVDNIAKDTDDLGDWLYNQFFKTIESQVVNGTVKEKPTRRSDIGSLFKKPRKFHKKGSSKKIKIKNNDLRRKLLRITEDDSMFDSQSESEDSSASSSSDSKSDTTAEGENDTHPNDKQHGHRKLIVINKKPKPPLPSFIFLPNIETQFYPPIGLPPPPAIPMFPMIPVPPMPVFPYPPGTTESPKTTTTKPENEEKQIETDKEREEREKKEREEQDRKEKEEQEKKDKDDKNTARAGREMMFRTQNSKRGQRKILRQSQQNLSPFLRDERKRNKRPSNRNFVHRKPDTPLFDELSPQDVPIHDEMKMKPIEDSQVPAPPEDVGFKYLSQLIHKVDPNITHEDLDKNTFEINSAAQPLRRTFETRYYNYDAQPPQYQPEQYQSQLNQQRQEYQPQQRQPTRTIGKRRFTTTRNEPDDSYYANLGQQIAALIRKVDSVGDRQIDAGLEPRTSPQPVFNGNSYSSRSYWERSVRSPLQHFGSNTGELDYIQRNYESLLNLEKKVEIFATTEHPLSLQEIENIVFLMDKAKLQLQEKIKSIDTFEPATQNLNINLLPRQSEISTTKQSNKVSFTNANSDDDISVPKQGEFGKRVSKVIIPKENAQDNIDLLPKNTKHSKSKRRKYDYFQEPIVLKNTNVIKNTSNAAEELRGILMHNFKNIAPDTGLRKVVPYTDLRYFAPNNGLRNVVPETDLENVAPNTEFRNISPNTDFKYVTPNTDFRNIVLKNNELYNNFRNSLINVDLSNVHNTDFRIEVPDTDTKNIVTNNQFKDVVQRSDIRRDLADKEIRNLVRRTDPKNIFNMLLQTYKNRTLENIHNTTLKKRNHKWIVEKIRKKPAINEKRNKMIENLLEQETNKNTFRTPIKTPQNDFSPSFVLPFISNVQSMSKVPSTKQTYHIDAKWDNSKDTNYVNNNINHYGFVKETLPFELSGNIRFDKPIPSYFHHELHHFDYFD